MDSKPISTYPQERCPSFRVNAEDVDVAFLYAISSLIAGRPKRSPTAPRDHVALISNMVRAGVVVPTSSRNNRIHQPATVAGAPK